MVQQAWDLDKGFASRLAHPRDCARLQATRGRAGANGNDKLAVGADVGDSFNIMLGGDGAFNQGNINLGIGVAWAGFKEMDNIEIVS